METEEFVADAGDVCDSCGRELVEGDRIFMPMHRRDPRAIYCSKACAAGEGKSGAQKFVDSILTPDEVDDFDRDRVKFQVELQKRGTPYPHEIVSAVWSATRDRNTGKVVPCLQILKDEALRFVALESFYDGSGSVFRFAGHPAGMVPTSDSLTPESIEKALQVLQKYPSPKPQWSHGKRLNGLDGGVIPFDFGARVDEILRESGFRPAPSGLGKKWKRAGRYTVLIARIHNWETGEVGFYLEGGPGAFVTGGSGRLLETAVANHRDLRAVLDGMLLIQDRREATGKFDGYDGDDVFKQCSCGRPFTKQQWDELPIHGIQNIPDDEIGPGYDLILKNCPTCVSTMALEDPPQEH